MACHVLIKTVAKTRYFLPLFARFWHKMAEFATICHEKKVSKWAPLQITPMDRKDKLHGHGALPRARPAHAIPLSSDSQHYVNFGSSARLRVHFTPEPRPMIQPLGTPPTY